MKKRLKLRVGTFIWHRQLPRLCDLDGLGGLVSSALWNVFHFLHDFITFQDLSKDYMLTIQPSNAALAESPAVVSRQLTYEVMAVVMKNWEPLVSFPELAMLSIPVLVCFNLKFSSGNLFP